MSFPGPVRFGLIFLLISAPSLISAYCEWYLLVVEAVFKLSTER